MFMLPNPLYNDNSQALSSVAAAALLSGTASANAQRDSITAFSSLTGFPNPLMLNALTAANAAAGGYLFNHPSLSLIPTALQLPKPEIKLAATLNPIQTTMANVKLQTNQKQDTSKHYHVFVGDLSPEVENHKLREAFSMFGIVTECRIIKDMHTQKPKGYGFVAYATREEAEEAINKMSGQILGSRPIRTNWAVRRPLQAAAAEHRPLNYDEVNAASSASNCTVYVGGITKGLSEDLLKRHFGDFGTILEIRLFKEKGYAFVRFDNHEAATNAIITMHGKDVGGQPCKCSWGKESSDNSLMKDQLSPSLLNLYQCYAANNNSLTLAAAAAVAGTNPYAAQPNLTPYLSSGALTLTHPNVSSLTSPSSAMFMMPLNATHQAQAAFR